MIIFVQKIRKNNEPIKLFFRPFLAKIGRKKILPKDHMLGYPDDHLCAKNQKKLMNQF